MDLATFITIIIGVPTCLALIFHITNPIEISWGKFVAVSVIVILLILAFVFFVRSEIPGGDPKETTDMFESITESRKSVPLTRCEFIDDSNQDGNNTDVCVNHWTDIHGKYHANSIKFWVINSPEWSRSEHITYRLSGQYETLSGTIVAEKESASGSTFVFTIYIDNVPTYTTGVITTADTYTFTYSICGANEIRIVCSTDTPYSGHCIFDAIVF